jgi:hypothetical protein
MGTSGALLLAGAAWALINCPAAFVRNVFGYGCYWGGWGVTYWLRWTPFQDFQLMDCEGLSLAQNRVIMALKLLMLAGVVTLAWRRRKMGGLDFFTTLGAAFAWIFVCMPGIGTQYMVWYAPFILILSPEWWAALTAGSAIYMARFYQSTSGFHFPWYLSMPHGPEAPYWAPWTNIAWATFIALALVRGRSWLLLGKRTGAVLPAPQIAPLEEQLPT